VEEQSTGEFSVAGGYSTSDGFMAEVSVAERNLLGRGQFAKAAVQYGQRARGFELSFVEPYMLGYRLAFGVDFFSKQILPSSFQAYEELAAALCGLPAGHNAWRQFELLPGRIADRRRSLHARVRGA
jgi:outer membrane protein insertion porin family